MLGYAVIGSYLMRRKDCKEWSALCAKDKSCVLVLLDTVFGGAKIAKRILIFIFNTYLH